MPGAGSCSAIFVCVSIETPVSAAVSASHVQIAHITRLNWSDKFARTSNFADLTAKRFIVFAVRAPRNEGAGRSTAC